MAYLSLVGAPLTALGYSLEALPQLKIAKQYFSDDFGQENRVKYLNYIRAQDCKPGCYERTVAYLNEHPVLGRRLIVATEIALRAVEVTGALMCATAATAALGLTAGSALFFTCVAISPLVSKLLTVQWPGFEGADYKINAVVLLASGVSAFIGLFPFKFMEFEILRDLAIFDTVMPAFYGLYQSCECTVDPKVYWQKYLSLMALKEQLKGELTIKQIDKAVLDLKMTLDFEFKGGLLPLKNTLLERLQELQLAKQAEAIRTKATELETQIKKCNFEDPDSIIKIRNELKGLMQFNMLIYCEAKVALLRTAVFSGQYSKKSIKMKEANDVSDLELNRKLIEDVGKLYLQKAMEKYQLHIDELEKIDPKEQPRQFLDVYEICLALNDPFEISEATISYEKNNSLLNWKGWLETVSNQHIRNILKDMIKPICPDMTVNTIRFQRFFAPTLNIALLSSKKTTTVK